MKITHKSIVFLALIVGAWVVPNSVQSQGFEGVVNMIMKIPALGETKLPISISVKGDKNVATLDIPMQGQSKIYGDSKKRTMTVVQVAQKTGMEIDQSKLDEITKANAGSASPPAKTGKKELIAGFSAEEYSSLSNGTAELDLWLAKDLPKTISDAIRASNEATMRMTQSGSEGFADLFKQGYTMLRTVVKQAGTAMFIMEFVGIEQKKIADSEFEIPSDIKIQKVDPTKPPPGAQQNSNSGAQIEPINTPPPQMEPPKK
ncbi:MAG: DUF4412 domain-containing protein [bacterium]